MEERLASHSEEPGGAASGHLENEDYISQLEEDGDVWDVYSVTPMIETALKVFFGETETSCV